MSLKPHNQGKIGDVLGYVSTGVVGWINPEKNREKIVLKKDKYEVTHRLHPESKTYVITLPKNQGKPGEILQLDENGFQVWSNRMSELEKKVNELEKLKEDVQKLLAEFKQF